MKVATLAVVATSIWSVAAQNRADYLPECSLKCLDDATQKVTNCALDDAVCWCVQKNYEDIYNAGVTCVLDACGSDKAIRQVLPGAAKFCAAATASAKAASTPAPTASTSQTSSGAVGNSTAHVTTGPTSSPASTSASSSAKSTTASPAAAASSGPIAGAVLLLAGALAAL